MFIAVFVVYSEHSHFNPFRTGGGPVLVFFLPTFINYVLSIIWQSFLLIFHVDPCVIDLRPGPTMELRSTPFILKILI